MRNRLTQGGLVALIVALLAIAGTGMLTPNSTAADRVQRLEQELRCPVCASVSIAESPSETAQAMRTVVERQVRAGRTDDQIIDYFRARYGDWVLLNPPARGNTLLVWLLPLAAIAVGGLVLLLRSLRKPPVAVSGSTNVDDDLDAEQP